MVATENRKKLGQRRVTWREKERQRETERETERERQALLSGIILFWVWKGPDTLFKLINQLRKLSPGPPPNQSILFPG